MDKTVNFTLTRIYTQPSSKLWIVRGDEELAKYNYMSRTAAPDWGYLRQTPCIYRFSYKPEKDPTEYRVDVSQLEQEHIRINNYDGQGYRRCWNYLFAVGTAYFNNVGYPKMLYAFMANNILKEIEVVEFEGNWYLKFETIKPTTNTTGMTRETHPHFIHLWDLISGTDRESTSHTNITPRGLMYNFLVSKEGYGYIPIESVKPF